MHHEVKSSNQGVNQDRRTLLKSVACVGTVSFAPAVFGKALSSNSTFTLSGQLVCSAYNPTKTLVLKNSSAQTIVIDQIAQGALMFDGSVVDCNTACLSEPIVVPGNQEIQVDFDRRHQNAITRNIEDYRRIQSRVTRRRDGTRVIPFSVSVKENVATLV